MTIKYMKFFLYYIFLKKKKTGQLRGTKIIKGDF